MYASASVSPLDAEWLAQSKPRIEPLPVSWMEESKKNSRRVHDGRASVSGLGVAQREPGEDARGGVDVVLVVAAVDADRVQLEQLASVVLVGGVLRRLRVVQVEQHRRVLGRGQQHVLVLAERVLADDLAVVEVAAVPRVAGAGDVEVVRPELGHHLEQLPLAPERAPDGRVEQVLHDLPAEVVQPQVVGLRPELGVPHLQDRPLQPGEVREHRVGDAVADRRGVELLLEPLTSPEGARRATPGSGSARRSPSAAGAACRRCRAGWMPWERHRPPGGRPRSARQMQGRPGSSTLQPSPCRLRLRRERSGARGSPSPGSRRPRGHPVRCADRVSARSDPPRRGRACGLTGSVP